MTASEAREGNKKCMINVIARAASYMFCCEGIVETDIIIDTIILGKHRVLSREED